MSAKHLPLINSPVCRGRETLQFSASPRIGFVNRSRSTDGTALSDEPRCAQRLLELVAHKRKECAARLSPMRQMELD